MIHSLLLKICFFQGCVYRWKAVITHKLQTTIVETEALIMGYFLKSIATGGVMMAKPQEQLMPVIYPAA